jgi:hypothetical protein
MVIIGHSCRISGSEVVEDSTGSREKTLEAAGVDGEDSARRKQCPSNATQAHN